MRPMILAFTATALLMLSAPAALAGPTCQDQNGDSLRCGGPGAMPVGWTLPADQRPSQRAVPITPGVLVSLIGVIGGFFALIALMPQFESSRGGDWDEQEGDREDLG